MLLLKGTYVLHRRQSGFKANLSCQTALPDLVNRWVHGIGASKTIGTVFMDYRQAFHLLNQEISLYEFELYTVVIKY